MAQKRMFSLSVVDTDKFLDMSSSAQALYFHLGLHGDDDGFVASPKRIARTVGCNDDDLRLLAAKGFIIPFNSGVVVITDWNINNTLKNDRYHETVYQEEKAKISTLPSGKYVLGSSVVPECFQDGSSVEPEHNVTKHSITEQNKEGADKPPTPTPRRRFVPPTLEEVTAYVRERGSAVDPQGFIDFYSSKNWMVGKNKMVDWQAACRNAEHWERWSKLQPTDRNRLHTDADYSAGSGDFFGGES